MASRPAPNQKLIRGRLRRQLASGLTERGSPLSEEWMVEHWPNLLDIHVSAPRPGRAIAIQDVTFMLSEETFRITDCMSGAASSSTDAPRRLLDAELRAIGAWLEAYRARANLPAPPSCAQPRFFMPGGYIGRGGPPFSCWFPPKRRESLGPSCAPGNPIQPPELDPRLVSWHSLFRDTPRPP